MSRNRPIDTLRINDSEREHLLETLEKLAAESHVARNIRAHDRVTFTIKPFAVTFLHPGGVETRCLVTARNLSVGGLGFLHGGFLYDGTRCQLHVPTIYGDRRTLTGAVRSCRHISGNIHEVGVQFDEPIDPYEFLEAGDAPAGRHAESVTAPSLAGVVLAVQNFPPDAKLLEHHLASTKIKLTTAREYDEARTDVSAGRIDLIIVDDHALGANGGADIMQAIKMDDFNGPVIALTSDGSTAWLSSVRQHGFADVLIKPYDVGKLYACLARRLPDGEGNGAGKIFSELATSPGAIDLLKSFLAEVETAVEEVQGSLAKGDRQTMRSLCLGLKGSGRGYGYPRLSDAARDVVQAIDSDQPENDVELAIKRLDLVFQRLSAEAPVESNPAPAAEHDDS